MPGELVGFLGVAVLVIVTPGPDTALTIRNTLLGGRGAGIATAFWTKPWGRRPIEEAPRPIRTSAESVVYPWKLR